MHFLYERFFVEGNAKRRVVETNALDNPFLPDRYIDMLEDMTGVAYERYVLGKWVAMEGRVYDMFEPKTHVIERGGPWIEKILCIDEGFTLPQVILKCGFDSDGRMHVLEEFYDTHVLPSDFVDAAEGMMDPNVEAVYVDPAAAGLRAEMTERGLPIRNADNDVLSGIRAVQDRLAVRGDNRPRLSIDPSCINTKREFLTYQWKKKGGDRPKKENDHAMDALRYGVYTHDSRAYKRKRSRKGTVVSTG
jgi:phage terminase large subunit